MSGCACEIDDKVRPITGGYIKKGASEIEIQRHVLDMVRKGLMEVPSNVVTTEVITDQIRVSESDIKAIESEIWFKARFGFTLGRRGRLAIFDLIDRYDLTDQEVRRLNRARCVHWDGQTLRIRSTKAYMYLGWIQIIPLVLLFHLPILYALMSPDISVGAKLGLMGIGAVFAVLIYWMYDLYVAPHRVTKRK